LSPGPAVSNPSPAVPSSWARCSSREPHKRPQHSPEPSVVFRSDVWELDEQYLIPGHH
jgi:hypothetical protein